jgi:hypothetical protein
MDETIRRAARRSGALLAALLCAAGAASAQAGDAGTPAPDKCQPAPDVSQVRVTRVYGTEALAALTDPAKADQALPRAPVVALRHGVTLKVERLQALLDRARCSPQPRKVVLFLDGRPLAAEPYPPSAPESGLVNFVITRDESTPSLRETWIHLLGTPSFVPKEVPISVGIADEYAVPSREHVLLRVIPLGWFAGWSVLFVFLLAAFWALAVQSDLLRDPGPDPAAGGRKAYSLSRMQAAVWFFLILASYVFIGMITGDYGTTITSTVLGLMGISAGTAVGSAVIDSVPAADKAPAATRGSWWLDILSDQQAVSFHRFQMAAWTLVLAVIFVQHVYRGLAMPDFDATLLGLLGISAGTFLGLKATTEPK